MHFWRRADDPGMANARGDRINRGGVMKVDLSGFLLSELRDMMDEYKKAKAAGDDDLAREKAFACASLNRRLASNVPSMEEKYLGHADRWEQIATGRSPHPANRKNRKRNTGKGSRQNAQAEGEQDGDDTFDASGLITKSKVRWDDIGGLDEVKRLMMETIVIAGLKKPESVKPWKGILLYGPPGTGKTLLAAAAAGSLNASFFDVKADKIVSKYFGESSKLISGLYSAARSHAPSIIFLDEFDALSQSRSDDTSDATRKLLSSLLTELDGLQDKKSDRLLLTLAATNTPWDLDTAVLSRFPRRIFIPLPDEAACREIIRIHTESLDISSLDLDELGAECVQRRYSGRDIHTLCQQAMWTMIRDKNRNLHSLATLSFEELQKRSLKVRPLSTDDFTQALARIKSPVTRADLDRFTAWSEEFGEDFS